MQTHMTWPPDGGCCPSSSTVSSGLESVRGSSIASPTICICSIDRSVACMHWPNGGEWPRQQTVSRGGHMHGAHCPAQLDLYTWDDRAALGFAVRAAAAHGNGAFLCVCPLPLAGLPLWLHLESSVDRRWMQRKFYVLLLFYSSLFFKKGAHKNRESMHVYVRRGDARIYHSHADVFPLTLEYRIRDSSLLSGRSLASLKRSPRQCRRRGCRRTDGCHSSASLQVQVQPMLVAIAATPSESVSSQVLV